MAQNKQRSPGKGKSDKQREAMANASFEEAETQMTSDNFASTEFGNDVQEIRSFSDDSPEPVVIHPHESQSYGTQNGSYNDEFSGEWEEDKDRSWKEESSWSQDSESEGRSIPEMFSDRVDDLKEYAGHLVNGTFDKLKDEWKYNRKGLIRKAAVTAVVTTAAVALAVALKNRRTRAFA